MSTIGKSIGGVGKDIDYSEKPVSSALVYCRNELDMGGDFMGQFKALSDDDKAWFKAAAVAEIEANNVPHKF